MGITKLMHMKESPGTPYIHLKNGIEYILDEKHHQAKTCGGIWVGGNCGSQSREILQKFLQTKDAYGKTDGRQGYHFVISFRPGEVDEQKAYAIAKDFCEEYLRDHFDYVFAIHNDKAHMHAHIIFNSVSRLDGSKYHYKDGDWEKWIQPVTDRICINHDVAPLEFSKDVKGVSYAQWLAQNNGRVTKKEIVYADVDYAVEKSTTWESFVKIMAQMGYHIKEGYSRMRKCDYISFQPPVSEGKRRRAFRSYNLRPGYSKAELIQRMGKKMDIPSYTILTDKMSRMLPKGLKKLSEHHFRKTVVYKRLYQAVNYYTLPNPYAVPAARVRKDMIQIHKLADQCLYLEKNKLYSLEAIKQKKAAIQEQGDALKRLKKSMDTVRTMENRLSNDQKERVIRCRELLQILEHPTDDLAWESAANELETLQTRLPEGILENQKRLVVTETLLRQIHQERKLLDSILEAEDPDEILSKRVFGYLKK